MRSGLEVLLADRLDLVRGRRIGLCVNHTAVDGRLRHAIDGLAAADGVQLVRLFGPEHGVRATVQDMVGLDEARDPVTGVPVVSLYGHDEASLRPKPAHFADLDAVVVDIQDIGARFYTYQATMAFVMQEAGRQGVPVVVLDRPNPITGEHVEGGIVHPGFDSFVGQWPLAVRHGMTMGELARWFCAHGGVTADVEIVRCEGWRRGMWFEETRLPWVYPSPNMPTVDTATIYPGMCLFEATNLSEGRGTTRPFHLFGAPWLDALQTVGWCERFAATAGLEGVGFRPAAFIPGFQKHAGHQCAGVEVHVLDRDRVDAFLLGVVTLLAARAAAPDAFGWRDAPYEFVTRAPAIDLLTGSAAFRHAIEAAPPSDAIDAIAGVRATWELERQAFLQTRADALIYPA